MQHPQFKELASFALTCLITPISNTVVERVFPLFTSIKNKARNGLQLSLLEAIIRIGSELAHSNKCCKESVLSSKMLSLFKAKKLYSKKPSIQSTESVLMKRETFLKKRFYVM